MSMVIECKVGDVRLCASFGVGCEESELNVSGSYTPLMIKKLQQILLGIIHEE